MSRVSSIYDFRKRPDSPSYTIYRDLPATEVHVPPEPIRDVICGSTKIVGGCLAFPVLCPLNVVAGATMMVYGCLCCRICDRRFENQRNEFCHHCGVTSAARVSSSLMITGVNEIRRTCVEQEMVR